VSGLSSSGLRLEKRCGNEGGIRVEGLCGPLGDSHSRVLARGRVWDDKWLSLAIPATMWRQVE
jgi:hypothetical protein